VDISANVPTLNGKDVSGKAGKQTGLADIPVEGLQAKCLWWRRKPGRTSKVEAMIRRDKKLWNPTTRRTMMIQLFASQP
jgi:hypothetical protein